MPRPRVAPLTRRVIAQAALRLMDRIGYDAFSMPRLGSELEIRTPSLYHHFADRAELMAEVARVVTLETELPQLPADAHWTEYFVELAVNFRHTILRHRQAAPVLLRFLPRDVMASLYEAAAVRLATDSPVALRDHALLLDGLEKLTLGTALSEATADRTRSSLFPTLDPQHHPQLAAAVAVAHIDADEAFVASVRSYLDGVALRSAPAAAERGHGPSSVPG